MNKVNPKEEQKRMELYRQGLSDGEIGRRLGKKKGCIRHWRQSRGLIANYHCRYEGQEFLSVNRGKDCSVPMEYALLPEQCEVMRSFLRLLVFASQRQPKTAFSVVKIMKGWRDAVFGYRRGDCIKQALNNSTNWKRGDKQHVPIGN